jgi:hypothetical protein
MRYADYAPSTHESEFIALRSMKAVSQYCRNFT